MKYIESGGKGMEENQLLQYLPSWLTWIGAPPPPEGEHDWGTRMSHGSRRPVAVAQGKGTTSSL